MGTRPNDTLRAVRMGMRMSQDDFALAIQRAGDQLGQPNAANKRLVQRWESGEIEMPRPAYARALEMVTRLPVTSLGFPAGADAVIVDDGRGGHDLLVRETALPRPSGPMRAGGSYSGIWLSTYDYHSSGRNQTYTNSHYIVVLQHENRLTVRSVHGPEKSLLTMDLTVDGSVVTGIWSEETERDSYYRGARYHGAIQMLAEPTGRRITGKWVGFGKEMDINTGPWTLTFVDASTGKAAIEKYSEPPSEDR